MKIKEKKYLCKKEYIYNYITRFVFTFGNTIIDTFGTVMMYKSGMSISLILLLYGIRFGLMGLLSPMYIKIASKYGIAFCRLIANICRIITSYMLITNNYNLPIFIITMALAGAISNPIENAISAKYIDEKYRGKYNSIRAIVGAVATVLATALITAGIIFNNNTYTIIIVTIAFILQVVFVKKLDYKPEYKRSSSYKELLVDTIKIKTPAKQVNIVKAFDIVERFFVPLYIYIALNDFVAFSTVIIISLTIQSIVLFASGAYMDKNMTKTNNVASALKAIVTGVFLIAKNKIVMSVNNMFYDNIKKMYETSYTTAMQTMIEESEKDNDKLATLSEMWLCFTELIELLILAIFAYYIKEKVFILLFIFELLAIFYGRNKINKYYKKKNVYYRAQTKQKEEKNGTRN